MAHLDRCNVTVCGHNIRIEIKDDSILGATETTYIINITLIITEITDVKVVTRNLNAIKIADRKLIN